ESAPLEQSKARLLSPRRLRSESLWRREGERARRPRGSTKDRFPPPRPGRGARAGTVRDAPLRARQGVTSVDLLERRRELLGRDEFIEPRDLFARLVDEEHRRQTDDVVLLLHRLELGRLVVGAVDLDGHEPRALVPDLRGRERA